MDSDELMLEQYFKPEENFVLFGLYEILSTESAKKEPVASSTPNPIGVQNNTFKKHIICQLTYSQLSQAFNSQRKTLFQHHLARCAKNSS